MIQSLVFLDSLLFSQIIRANQGETPVPGCATGGSAPALSTTSMLNRAKTRLKLTFLKDTGQNLVGCQRSDVGQSRHIEELYRRPFPAVGFPPNYSQRRGALHRKREEHHQRNCTADGHVVP